MYTLTAIPKREAFWPVVMALIALALSSLPYLAGALVQTPQSVFSGAVFARADYSVHLAAMHSGMRGEWAYRLQFTSEDHAGAYVKLTYVLLGHLARWAGLSAEVIYHLARWFFGLICCLAVYDLYRQIFSSRFERLMAFGLALLGSGLGVWQMLLGWSPDPQISPIDFWLIDPYLFFGALVFPHFLLASGAMAGCFALFLRELRQPQARNWLGMAVCGWVMQVAQPLLIVVVGLCLAGLVLAAWWREERLFRRQLAGSGLLIVSQAPFFIYQALVLTRLPVWSGFTRQNVTLSPQVIYYLLGFGPFWPFVGMALAQLFRGWRARRDEQAEAFAPGLWLACTWALIDLALAYSPTAAQRRFTHALVVPLGALATYGFTHAFLPWAERTGKGWITARRGSLAFLLVLFASISSLYLSAGTTFYVLQHPEALFEPGEMRQAAAWLQDHAQPGQVVLAAESTSQYLAASAGLRVYSGHPIETLDYPTKSANVTAFYRGELGLADLAAPCVEWVVYGPRERRLGEPLIVGQPLRLRYTNSSVEIYEGLLQ